MKGQLSLISIESLYDEFGSKYCKDRISKGLLVNDFIERPVLLDTISKIRRRKKSDIKKVLDVGCGPGVYTKDLAGLGMSVTAIDISKEMISIASEYCSNNLSTNENLTFQHTSFEDFDNKEEYFDLVLATFMLSYFDDLNFFFRKVRSMLTPSGRVVTSILHPIRLFSSGKRGDCDGYNVCNYFQNGYYDSDVINDKSLVPLKRWNFQNICEAAFENGLLIEYILEPYPVDDIPEELTEKADFYRHNPSVALFVMRGV
ncbi:class I SAM-dependent methyltransferase [Pseudoalteromonas sp. JC28]|uniref:class I SAM-dependent methyltransferase n=1 Tax=Pseudoalteromonas sp. JC28 TaxID=2267617 RepID=UPI0015739484|nr:class I SAM-dependent methyltransferase [Pseudoalteromonas sp. JC28]NSY33711.1 class I SAM-dependent methyltransferase [Pseudoalteromonas sp. JC28]